MRHDAVHLAPLIRDRVSARSEQIVGFAGDLVRIPSETHPPGGDEGPVQRFVAARLAQLGLEVDVFEPWDVEGVESHEGWWPGLDYADRPNVVATWGEGRGPTLILNGHADVVPAGPRERWSSDPYGGEVRDGALWGRGAADMKGGIAAMVMAVEILRDCDLCPAGSVVIESVVNEELGGFNGTLACCAKGYVGDAAIVLEPTGLAISPASKGGQVYRAEVRGEAAHSAFWWRGTSALDKALLVKEALTAWERTRARECAAVPFFGQDSGYPLPAFADTIWSLRAGRPDVMANPEQAELLFWVDLLPGESRDAVLERFERFLVSYTGTDPFLAANPVELSRETMRPFLGNAIDPDHPIVATLGAAVEGLGLEKRLVGFPGACDAMIFNLYGDTPAVIFGPGDLAVAHAPDEYLPVEELLRAVEAIALAIVGFCGVEDG